MAGMAGIRVSAGWMAPVRAKAAALAGSGGFMDLVAGPLKEAEAVHADETPARAAGSPRYVHPARTRHLTHMHTGDRSADAIDDGGVLPGYQGILVRDGCHQGYWHLMSALHAWCGAHLLRDLKDLYEFEPGGPQEWAEQMAALLIEARDAARDARAAGNKTLDPDTVTALTSRYRQITRDGYARNCCRQTPAAKDACRIASRFMKHKDMILRFITRPDLGIFTNNQAGRDVRPVKVQRASGGCWRTLDGLADFAVVKSCLSTASKWGIAKIDALRGLFSGNPWMPDGIEPTLTG